MSRPMARNIDCVRLAVHDLDEALLFYRDELGHALIWRTTTAAGLRLPHGKAEIVLHTGGGPPEIDLKVADANLAAERFAAAGGRIVVPLFDIQIGRAVVVEDPWENRLVLLDDSKGLLKTDEAGNVIGNHPPSEA